MNNSTRIAEEKVSANYVDHYQRLAQYAIDAMANLKEVEIKGIEFLNQEHSFTTNNGIETRALALSVASIGGIAFTSVPYEMFSSSGVYIKENSPYEMTFISTCTNGYNTYMPTKDTFEYGGYEAEFALQNDLYHHRQLRLLPVEGSLRIPVLRSGYRYLRPGYGGKTGGYLCEYAESTL